MYKEPMFQGMIMIQSLKHHVDDKAQSRTTGARVPQTGQPTRGKATGGGLRTGEMEKDAFQNHGVSQILWERMCGTVTDGDTLSVCLNEGCGEYGHYNGDINKYFCLVCKNKYMATANNSQCSECGEGYNVNGGILECPSCGDSKVPPYYNMGRSDMCMTTKYFRDLLRVPGINMSFEYETNSQILAGMKQDMDTFNKLGSSGKYTISKDEVDEDELDEDEVDELDDELEDDLEDELDEEDMIADYDEF